jgi:DNA-binding CsgD family transcriptional regulator
LIILLHARESTKFAELRSCLEAAGHTVQALPVPPLIETADGYVFAIASSGSAPKAVTPGCANLSAREREIAELLLGHWRVPAIARQLAISPHTVRNHLKNIFAKLGVSSQQEVLDVLMRRATPRPPPPPEGAAESVGRPPFAGVRFEENGSARVEEH